MPHWNRHTVYKPDERAKDSENTKKCHEKDNNHNIISSINCFSIRTVSLPTSYEHRMLRTKRVHWNKGLFTWRTLKPVVSNFFKLAKSKPSTFLSCPPLFFFFSFTLKKRKKRKEYVLQNFKFQWGHNVTPPIQEFTFFFSVLATGGQPRQFPLYD